MRHDVHALVVWTVYDHPADHPGHVVPRKLLITADGSLQTDDVITSSQLERLRDTLQHTMGLGCLARSPADDPKVLESWL